LFAINILQASDKKNHWQLITQHGDTISASRLDRVTGDTLFFMCENCTGKIFADSLTGLIRVRYPHYARNIVLGTASGFVVGLIVGAAAGPNNGDENFYVPSQEDINVLTAGIIIGPLVGAATGILISVANNKN